MKVLRLTAGDRIMGFFCAVLVGGTAASLMERVIEGYLPPWTFSLLCPILMLCGAAMQMMIPFPWLRIETRRDWRGE